jgi:peptidoglycan/LPS O-acetylase OafA/YrhL
MLAVYLLIAPLVWPDVADHGRQALLAALYVSDYSVAWWGTPRLLSHTWSLAVEMHFYLAWPVVLLGVCKRWNGRERVHVLLTMYVLATMLRWVCTILDQSWQQVYYRTDTHMSGLILGAWLAAALRDDLWRNLLQRSLPWLLWLPVAAILCLRNYWGDLWMQMWGFTIAEWASVAVLVAVQRSSSQLAMMFSRPALVWLGKMSYGVYLWHYPLFVWMRARYSWDIVILVGLPASVCLAAISHCTIEKWAARFRGARNPLAGAVQAT